MPASSSDHPEVVVVLPAGVSVRDADRPLRRRLAKGRVAMCLRREPLSAVLDVLGIAPPREGLAALRKWGQCGEPPAGWLCAADPVFFEARLDHLRLFALDDVDDAELAALVERLQAQLATDRDYRFSSVGACGYLASGEPLATAAASARVAHGEVPDRFLPEGEGARLHDRLQGEVQMCLHGLEPNLQREARGRAPVNALWFWGGGVAPPRVRHALPVLFADDPLAGGYWSCADAPREPWPGSFAACAAAAGRGGFVAIPPPPPDADRPAYLAGLHEALVRSGVNAATLVFHDGLRADLTRGDRFRFWRREPGPLRDAVGG